MQDYYLFIILTDFFRNLYPLFITIFEFKKVFTGTGTYGQMINWSFRKCSHIRKDFRNFQFVVNMNLVICNIKASKSMAQWVWGDVTLWWDIESSSIQFVCCSYKMQQQHFIESCITVTIIGKMRVTRMTSGCLNNWSFCFYMY